MNTLKSILVIDDDEKYVESLRLSLSIKHKVMTAQNKIESLIVLHKNKIDLILLDFSLENETGHEILDEIRAQGFKIPIIVVTGNVTIEMSIGFLRKNIFGFLEKPFRFDELETLLKNCFNQVDDLNSNEEIQIINSELRTVASHGKVIKLTPTEFSLLDIFLSNQGSHVSRTLIENQIWGATNVSKNSIDTHLLNLKKKIPEFDNHLFSVYGTGFCYKPQIPL